MNYTQDNDKLYRYLFQNRAVRGEWVRLNQTFTDTLNTHHYPKAVQNLLGEMMVATNLLTATLKFNGNITVQIQGDGPLKLALVNGNDQQQIRALARVQGDIQDGMSQNNYKLSLLFARVNMKANQLLQECCYRLCRMAKVHQRILSI